MKLRILALTAASFLLAGCEGVEWGDFDRYKEDFHYSYNVSPGVHVYLENMNGAVEINGWEKNAVEVSGTKHASSEQVVKALTIDVVNSGDTLRIRTVPPSGHRGGYGAHYVIRVPSKAILEDIDTSNGSIRIEAVEGSARLRTSNGSLKIYRTTGPVDATTSNASVDVSDVSGDVMVRTSNGSVRASDVRGALDATSSNSGMNIELADTAAQRPIRLATSNGGVELNLGNFRDNDVRISTSNSGITLRLPPNARGMLKARTSNSSVNTDFDLTVKSGQLQKSYVEGVIGSGGGPLLDLSTSNGAIRVLKM